MLDSDVGINRTPGKEDLQLRAITVLKDAGIEAQGVQWTVGDLRDPGDLGFAGCLAVLRTTEFAALLPYARAA
jgi:hypothetical protein